MPAPSGDRFSGQNLADCRYCPPDGRKFRTPRQCASCGNPLCLVCRPEIPGQPFLCPACGGGEVEDTLHHPERSLQRLQAAGQQPPFWLTLLSTRTHSQTVSVEDVLVPE